MTDYTFHLVAIVPAEYLDQANALSKAQGWGDTVYSVELSASAYEPATHFGVATYVTSEFPSVLQAQAASNKSASDILSKVQMRITDISTSPDTTPRARFDEFAESLGLYRVKKPDEFAGQPES